MRRFPSTDTVTAAQATGATGNATFDRAYHELAEARAAYDAALGDPTRVPTLAHAAARLDAARRTMNATLSAA